MLPMELTDLPKTEGEGNGTPLQYSCLENPMDGGTWQAAVHGVAQLDTTEATQQQQQKDAQTFKLAWKRVFHETETRNFRYSFS